MGQNCSWHNTTSLETFLLFSRSGNSREGCLVLSLLLHSSSRPQAGWVARPHRLWTERKKLKICVYVFLCSPDTELACAEPGPAENPCSLMAEMVQKLGSGRSRDCLPGRAPSSVMSSLSRAALGSGGARKRCLCVCVYVCVCVCAASGRAMLPAGRGDGRKPPWEAGTW